MKTIDLGRECHGGPCCPTSAPATESASVEYPCLYLILKDGQDLSKLPAEGQMTVKFSVKRDDRDLKRSTRNIELDIEEILDFEPADKHTPTAEERFEEVAAEVRGDEDDEGE